MSEQNKKNKIDEIKNRLRKAPNGSGYFEDVSYLLQEIERKDEALRFYADKDNYSASRPGRMDIDLGQRAREAL